MAAPAADSGGADPAQGGEAQRSALDGTRWQRLWDLPTRLFHWVLVVLVALQFASAEFHWLSMQWHFRFGYATLGLLLFRIGWGFFGSQTSRFAQFVRSPVALARYLGALARGERVAVVGHNPLGGWSVLAMLALLLAQAVSGLFASDGIDTDGPYVDRVSGATVKWMTRVHHWGETALLVVIALHIVAVLLYLLLRGENLIAPMFSGRKNAVVAAPLRFVAGWRAMALFALAALLTAALAWFGD